MTWRLVTDVVTGTTSTVGGDDWNKLMNLLNGVADVDTVVINSDWTFNKTLNISKNAESGIAEVLFTFKSSDANGYLQVENFTVTNGLFAPRLWGRTMDASTVTPGLVIDAYFQAGQDSGTTPVMIMRSVQSDGASVVNRPLLEFRDWTKTILQIKASGQILHTTKAQTGVAEIMHQWKMDDATGTLDIRNASATDAHFVPWIFALATTTSSAVPGLYIYSNIPSTLDTGTVGGMILDTRLSNSTSVLVRPLITIRNMLVDVAKINAKGDFEHIIQSQATTSEIMHTWKVSDDAGSYLQILNSTNTDARFAPMILSITNNAADVGMYLDSRVSSDTGTVAGMVFITRTTGLTALATRPAFQFKTGTGSSTPLVEILGGGTVEHRIPAVASTAEEGYKLTLSDDASSYFKIKNGISTDAVFQPWIIGFCNTNTLSGLKVTSFINNTETGGVPALLLDHALASGAAIAVRPLLGIRNAGTEVFKINAYGDVLSTIKAQTGVAEILHKWVVSDDLGSFIQIDNASTTDVIFAPRITSREVTTSGVPPFTLISEVATGGDAGTIPIIVLNTRVTNLTAFTVRPLFDIQNNAVSVFKVNARGNITENITSQTGVFEQVHRWQVSDDTLSRLDVSNASGTDGHFAPLISGYYRQTLNSLAGLYIFAHIPAAHDSGTTPAMIIDSRRDDSIAIATRPLFDFRNFGTSVFKINANGDIKNTVIAQATASELVAEFGVSDATTSYLRILNYSATDAKFSPRIQGYYATTDAIHPGLTVDAYIFDTQDSGSIPIFQLRAVRSSGTAIVNRPLFHFNDWTTPVFKINATNFDFTDKDLLKTGYQDHKVYAVGSAPPDPPTGYAREYYRDIDGNNVGKFSKTKKAGAIVEVQIA